jgi:hypothetical protein
MTPPFVLIDPADLARVHRLHRGQFALPRLDWDQFQSLEDSTRLRASIRGIRSLFFRSGLSAAAERIDPDAGIPLPQQMNALQQTILRDISGYLAAPSEDLILQIFHQIQLWGGRAGRNIYVMEGGFEKNFEVEAYAEFARAASSLVDTVAERIQTLVRSVGRIRHFGPSFATKHGRFWAEAAIASPLAIYDSNIARGCFGRDTVQWSHYEGYLDSLTAVAGAERVSIQHLERAAFSFFASPAGRQWIDVRLG